MQTHCSMYNGKRILIRLNNLLGKQQTQSFVFNHQFMQRKQRNTKYAPTPRVFEWNSFTRLTNQIKKLLL